MRQYLDLLQRIVDEGGDVPCGAYLPKEERHPTCRTILAAQYRHDLGSGFPAVTTKRLYFDSVVDELLWFLRGETNIKRLGRYVATADGGREFVRRSIWDQWADEDGFVRNAYGTTWRDWQYPGIRTESWDQVDQIVTDLRAVKANPLDRARRRVILTGWNPPLVRTMGLPPCHTMSQWLVVNGRLNVSCYWRSIDMFTGFPFNVAQYALLAHLFAGAAGLEVGELVATIGDCHLYDNQMDLVREQLLRVPRRMPRLRIDPRFFEVAPDLDAQHLAGVDHAWLSLEDYEYDEGRSLRAEVAV